jgi:hypothetical protein
MKKVQIYVKTLCKLSDFKARPGPMKWSDVVKETAEKKINQMFL